MLTTALVLLLAACSGSGPAPATEPAPADLAATHGEATDELVADMRHLLSEAVEDHQSQLTFDAERRWHAAWTLWSTRLEPQVRDRDRVLAVRTEHAMGRLLDVFAAGRGRVGPAWTQMDAVLAEVANRLEEAAVPQEPPMNAVEPTP